MSRAKKIKSYSSKTYCFNKPRHCVNSFFDQQTNASIKTVQSYVDWVINGMKNSPIAVLTTILFFFTALCFAGKEK